MLFQHGGVNIAAHGVGLQHVTPVNPANRRGAGSFQEHRDRDRHADPDRRGNADEGNQKAHQGQDGQIRAKAADVATLVRDAVSHMRTPTIVGFLGRGEPDLTVVNDRILKALGLPAAAPREWLAPGERRPRRGMLRGLFSGGTLCDEAMLIATQHLGPIHSNIPLDPGWALGPDLRYEGHLMIDFGDDRLTQGRAHPMIDWTLRLERLAEEAADPACAVVLLDVVLGYGSHDAPAGVLVPAIRDARARARADGRDLAFVVSLTGTSGDPQGLEATAAALQEAGASVHLSNAAAARTASALVDVSALVERTA